MSRFLTGMAALTLLGAAALPLQANAAERHDGVSNVSTEMSAQRYWRGRHYGYWGPRRYWGPRYGYYGYPYRYGYYGYPYGYYRPGFALGVGPFGFRVF